MKKEIVIGISGGADSAASADLFKKAGYRVLGVTLNFLNDPVILEKAEKVGKECSIEHLIVDAQKEFETQVIIPFIEGYKKGETPNPCLFCNEHLKFKLLLQIANQYGIEKIGTGHYARILENKGFFELHASENKRKDQSYFLYHLSQETLSRLIFPINHFKSKKEVKESIGKKLPEIATGPESQGICFIPKGGHTLFLKEKIYGSQPVAPGNILDDTGKILGRHKGVLSFTLGQTRKLGIENPKGLGVIHIDGETNTLVLGSKEQLLKKKILIYRVKLMVEKKEILNKIIDFKVSRWSNVYQGMVTENKDKELVIKSAEAVRAPTPGQALVFYEGDRVLGGGIIKPLKFIMSRV